MANAHIFTEIAMGFKGVIQKPHFEKTGYSIGKSLFATVNNDFTLGCVKLTPGSQKEFEKIHKAVYPVPNSWGKKGWTYLDLLNIPEALLAEIMETAYNKFNKQQ